MTFFKLRQIEILVSFIIVRSIILLVNTKISTMPHLSMMALNKKEKACSK